MLDLARLLDISVSVFVVVLIGFWVRQDVMRLMDRMQNQIDDCLKRDEKNPD